YRSAALVVDASADPLFVLVSPWSTDDSSERFDAMSAVLADIATTHDDVGFLNLHLLAGAHVHTDGSILHDGIHCGDDDDADYMMSLLWNQIERENAGLHDVVIGGDAVPLPTLALTPGSTLHIASGFHEGPLICPDGELHVRGWNRWTCGVSADASSSLIVPPTANVHVQRCSLTGGIADVGGTVHCRGALSLLEVDVHGGTAHRGGLIDVVDGVMDIHDCRLGDGHADEGGGVAVATSTVTMSDTRLSESIANTAGGLLVTSGIVELHAMDILMNSAQEAGGILVRDEGQLTVSDSLVCSNEPDDVVGVFQDGGGNTIGGTCSCLGDLNESGAVEVDDLLQLLGAWGSGEAGDIDNDGDTDVNDLLLLLGGWGPC
ncbi:MAG: hypothetical protein MK074_09580, partial [Phycisphaerales bacterium]|nr:hypothetical protein [Phycisphaerales bacterium]